MKTREEIAELALKAVGDKVKPRTCQQWTRELVGAPSVGDVDGDGAPDAEDGYKSEPFSARHDGDRNPPAGVPLYWEGGSEDNGHRAWSIGNQEFVGVDTPREGFIGRVHLDWVERNWGLRYVGWTKTISGILIPEEKETKPLREPRPDTKLGKALANLRSARNRAKANGYTARVEELNQSIQKLLEGYNKKK